MSKLKKIIFVTLVFFALTNKAFAIFEYKIEKVLDNGDYIINGLHWKAHSECKAWKKGDKITFSNKDAHGKCIITSVLHQNSKATCKLWCSDNMHDGI